MSKPTQIGIIGCGNISQAYFRTAKQLNDIEIKACADLNMDAARAKAEENGVQAMTIDQVLADKDIEIIVNLTTPQAHAPVNKQALEAGKHVHCEKPFAITREEAREVLELAEKKGLRVGSAPDTFLGGGLQTCRKLIDDQWIGRPTSGTATLALPGHERWHPNPGFYYMTGGGPIFDMGPYYITALVHLLGPVKRVTAMTSRARQTRIATSEQAFGQELPVEIDTHAAGILEFANGAIITMILSFDVAKHSAHPIEVHGTAGSLKVPDPNNFSGDIWLARTGDKEWQQAPYAYGYLDNLRCIGVADMAAAIRTGRPHRCNGELAYHVLDVMHAFEDSSKRGQHVALESTCAQPTPLPLGLLPGELEI